MIIIIVITHCQNFEAVDVEGFGLDEADEKYDIDGELNAKEHVKYTKLTKRRKEKRGNSKADNLMKRFETNIDLFDEEEKTELLQLIEEIREREIQGSL